MKPRNRKGTDMVLYRFPQKLLFGILLKYLGEPFSFFSKYANYRLLSWKMLEVSASWIIQQRNYFTLAYSTRKPI